MEASEDEPGWIEAEFGFRPFDEYLRRAERHDFDEQPVLVVESFDPSIDLMNPFWVYQLADKGVEVIETQEDSPHLERFCEWSRAEARTRPAFRALNVVLRDSRE